MKSKDIKNDYDDDNIPDVDLPQGENVVKPVEPLPESTRPRKDGPGGDNGASPPSSLHMTFFFLLSIFAHLSHYLSLVIY